MVSPDVCVGCEASVTCAQGLTEALKRVGVVPRPAHEFCRAGDSVVKVTGAAASEVFLKDSGPGATLISDTGAGSDEVAYFCVNGRLLLSAPGGPHVP